MLDKLSTIEIRKNLSLFNSECLENLTVQYWLTLNF